MKIVCLVKQIPRPDEIEFDQETKSLKREGVPLILNPFDARAVAEAVRLREAVGGKVVAMTMGPPQAEEALRECLALGADRCIHLSDRAFALADTIGTSRTLALALGKEGCDLVLCGLKTLDAETWQVPPETAGFLGRPHVTSSIGLPLAGGRARGRPARARSGPPSKAAGCACAATPMTVKRRSRCRSRQSSRSRAANGSPTRRSRRTGRSPSGARPTSSPRCTSTTSASARPARPHAFSPYAMSPRSGAANAFPRPRRRS